MLEMTQTEYARHRGVSRQAVNKLVKAGKIPLVTASCGDGGLTKISASSLPHKKPRQMAERHACSNIKQHFQ
jgi:hypothetical protein